eukprot:scaffold60432_cov60-Cyclotella_meneghiniana.AAC.1
MIKTRNSILFSIAAFGCLCCSAVSLQDATSPLRQQRSLQQDDLCSSIVAIASSSQQEDEEEDELEQFLCEHSTTGELLPLVATDIQLTSLREALYTGELISAESTLVGLTSEDNLQTVDFVSDNNDNSTTSATVVETVVTNLPAVLEFKPSSGGNYSRRRRRGLIHRHRAVEEEQQHSHHGERDLADYTGVMKNSRCRFTRKAN